LLLSAGCRKEYSYEGGPSTVAPVDTGVTTEPLPPAPLIGVCAACTDAAGSDPATWGFRLEGIAACGPVTRAVMSIEKNAFTFFGPSSCSSDSGLIITAYFNEPFFTQDRSGLPAASAFLSYYDNTTNNDFLSSNNQHRITVWIDNYLHATRTATGTFSGSALTPDGKVHPVTAGKFRIQF
jgi:hypothetical protein